MKKSKTDTVVIGGGAAGLMCALKAAERGRGVVILEPNAVLGKKLRITGKGRCNLTNDCPAGEVIASIPGAGKFLYGPLSRFSCSDTIAFFESLGVPLKTERGKRVFPLSDDADDGANALVKAALRAGASVTKERALAILTDDRGKISGVRTEHETIECASAVICTGGMSYPGTGSTGDGYKMAAALGHGIVPPRPSLVPLESDDAYCAEMQGLSLRNVALSALDGKGALLYKAEGEMLFTHFGVSGPLVLSASAHMRDFGKTKYRLSIDLKPGLDEKKLDLRILRDFEKYKNRDFENSLSDLAPRALIPVLVGLSGIPGREKVNAVTKAQRAGLVGLLKAFPISVKGPRPMAEAIITAGGVALRDVDPRTMESKIVQGLYFAGEVLDLDAYTGGFNLQIAWSTGFTAGMNA